MDDDGKEGWRRRRIGEGKMKRTMENTDEKTFVTHE